jgi:hypothetical protein
MHCKELVILEGRQGVENNTLTLKTAEGVISTTRATTEPPKHGGGGGIIAQQTKRAEGITRSASIRLKHGLRRITLPYPMVSTSHDE